jgi:hypothetical protein
MTDFDPTTFTEQMRAIRDRQRDDSRRPDQETDHVDADDLMVAMLRHHGYDEAMDVFEQLDIWYA